MEFIDTFADVPRLRLIVGIGSGILGVLFLWRGLGGLRRRFVQGRSDDRSPREWGANALDGPAGIPAEATDRRSKTRTEAGSVPGGQRTGDNRAKREPSAGVNVRHGLVAADPKMRARMTACVRPVLVGCLDALRPKALLVEQCASPERALSAAELADLRLPLLPSLGEVAEEMAELDQTMRRRIGRIADDYDALQGAIARLPELLDDGPLGSEWTAFLDSRFTGLVSDIEELLHELEQKP